MFFVECVFRGIPNSHSVSNRTPVPAVIEQRFCFKSNSDSVLNSNAFPALPGIAVRIGSECVFELIQNKG